MLALKIRFTIFPSLLSMFRHCFCAFWCMHQCIRKSYVVQCTHGEYQAGNELCTSYSNSKSLWKSFNDISCSFLSIAKLLPLSSIMAMMTEEMKNYTKAPKSQHSPGRWRQQQQRNLHSIYCHFQLQTLYNLTQTGFLFCFIIFSNPTYLTPLSAFSLYVHAVLRTRSLSVNY